MDNWIEVHYDSLKADMHFQFNGFMLWFCNFYGVLSAQITPNAHRILSCFPQICGRHQLPSSIKLFNYLHTVKLGGKKVGSDYVMVQCRQSVSKIDDLPNNNKGWKIKYFKVLLSDHFPPQMRMVLSVCNCKQPAKTPGIKEAIRRISLESYDWDTFYLANALEDA